MFSGEQQRWSWYDFGRLKELRDPIILALSKLVAPGSKLDSQYLSPFVVDVDALTWLQR